MWPIDAEFLYDLLSNLTSIDAFVLKCCRKSMPIGRNGNARCYLGYFCGSRRVN